MRRGVAAGIAAFVTLTTLTPAALPSAAFAQTTEKPGGKGGSAAPSEAQQAKPPENPGIAAAKEVVAQIEQAITARPADPNLRYYLAHYQLQAGDKKGALASLETVRTMADGFLPTPDFFGDFGDDPAYQALYRQFEAQLPKVSGGKLIYRHTDRHFLPEGIAAYQRDIFIASMANGQIVRLRAGRTPTLFNKGDGTPRLGLTLDAPRRRLCSATTNGFLAAAETARRNRVECMALSNGKMLSSFTLPDAVQLNDLIADPADGTLYATDSAGGSVWKITPAGTVSRLVDAIGGANGIALDGQGRLYIAHNSGIARLDLASGKIDRSRLAVPARDTVAGIDGLYWYKGDLIGIQNVTNPGRVIRISLSDDGAVTRVTTVQSHHDEWINEPTTAAIAGDTLYLLATTQVSRLRPDGSIQDAATVKPAAVAAIKLQ